MSYRLYIDDIRNPQDCIGYMSQRMKGDTSIYAENWIVVRSFDEFTRHIIMNGNPDIISFDHDLAPEHYIPGDRGLLHAGELEGSELNGYDAAVWYMNYAKRMKWTIPQIIVHSMNPIGTERIQSLFK